MPNSWGGLLSVLFIHLFVYFMKLDEPWSFLPVSSATMRLFFPFERNCAAELTSQDESGRMCNTSVTGEESLHRRLFKYSLQVQIQFCSF